MIPSMLNHKTLTFLFSLFSILFTSLAVDFITSTQSLLDGNTIVSSDGSFELGFFSIGDSKNRYVGIWYNKISLKTFVWVANRDVPLKDSSGKLTLSENGVLRLYNSTKGVIWSSVLLSSLISADGPIAQLLDTGNFVVKNENDEDFIWESFRYPGNMFLPGMKYGINLVTGVNSYLTSWRTPEDPSKGNFTNKIDPNGVPQFFLQKDSVDVFRSGSWNGLRFSGMPNLKPNSIYKFEFVFNEVEVYYKYELINKSVVSRMELNTLGALLRFTWVDRTHGWNLYLNAMMDNCDRYALCGPHGTCDINNSPACGCLKGFVPKHPDDWSGADWSHGCVRKVELSCGDGEDFLKYLGVKLPDTRKSWYNKTMDLKECKKVCLQNCNCTAYADLDVRDGGSGCIHWFGDLIDIREYDETGQAIYVRMAASEIGNDIDLYTRRNVFLMLLMVLLNGYAYTLVLGVAEKYETSQGKKHVKIIIIAVVSSASLVFLVVFIVFFILKKRNKGKTEGTI